MDSLIFFLVVFVSVFFLIFLLGYSDNSGGSFLGKFFPRPADVTWKDKAETAKTEAKKRMGCASDNKPVCFNGEIPKCVQIKTENGEQEKMWQCNYYRLAPFQDGSYIYPAFPASYRTINASDFNGELQICNDLSNPYDPNYSYDTSCGFGTFNSQGTASISNYGEYSPGDITGFRLQYENPNVYGFERVNNVNGSSIFQAATSSTLAPTIDVCEKQCVNDKGDGTTNGQNGCYGYVYNPTTKTCNTHSLVSTTRVSGSSKVLRNPSFVPDQFL
jgi:hypothetical protein